MHLIYFTEQPMAAYPEEEALKRDGTTILTFSNQFYDPVEGSRLYNERIEEYLLAEEVGFDAIMLNEHHNAPFCMQPSWTVFASILAAITKRVKIIMLGVPLPVLDSPLRAAEELSMIDMISKGRLVAGIVRGAGTEQYAMNANPAFNRERFQEAHDLLIKAWTQPGPFRWEGDHYQFRVVNPWAVPLQKPHPRIFVPGVVSTETIVWAAEHRYPYIALNLNVPETLRVFDLYGQKAKETGYEAGPEQRGYLMRIHVQDTEEKALENGRQFMWMQGEFTGMGHPVWAAPPGYMSAATRRKMLEASAHGPRYGDYETQLRDMTIMAGTPKQVVEKLRIFLEQTRPSMLILWGNDGKINHEDSMNCIKLLGEEVLPAVREIGKSLGLDSPFEKNTPVSTQFADVPVGAPV